MPLARKSREVICRRVAVYSGAVKQPLPVPRHGTKWQEALGPFAVALPNLSRQTIDKWAGETIPLSSWAGAYYHLRKAKGQRHQAILRSLTFKWMRILFRSWKERTGMPRGPTWMHCGGVGCQSSRLWQKTPLCLDCLPQGVCWAALRHPFKFSL